MTCWTYNNRGLMVAKNYADNNSVNYTYNADGQLLTRTWARQINGEPLTTTYSYDAAGRQTGYSYNDGITPAVSMTLNYLDQTTGITDAVGTRNLTYNAQKRLANETNPSIVNGVQNYTYDTYGRRSGMTFGNGTSTFANAAYTYDTAGRIATVGNGADTLTYSYVPGTGMVASQAWTNANINTAYTYDPYKRLTHITVNNTPVYGYTLNTKNQRTAATLPDGNTWAYGYDTLGQLTGAQKQDGAALLQNMLYNYDLIGNYTSNLVNQYTAFNTDTPTYDADGNMLTNGAWQYTWNAENRMTAAENATTGVRVEADYDYMGRRLYKMVYENNLLTKHAKFAYDGYKLIAEIDALNGNTKLASYLWQPVGLDVPLMRNEEYFVADGNKNIIELRDNSGTVTDSYSYDPFGKATHSGGSDNPFQFSSEYYDPEIKTVYYNFRNYLPSIAKWTSRDPIEEKGGVNLYGMLNNNSISFYDRDGLLLIHRDGEPQARACLNRKNESVGNLASAIKLNEQEWNFWLRNIDNSIVSKVERFKWYKIPNTVVAFWAGDMGQVGRWWISWGSNMENLNSSGFYVDEVKNEDITNAYTQRLNSSLARAELHGTYFWGHGFAPYPSSGLTNSNGRRLLMYKNFKLTYQIAFANIYACDSNSGKSSFPATDWTGFSGTLYPINPWDGDWSLW